MKKYIGLSIIALSMGLASCNDYLDKLPDNRAALNTEEKIIKFIGSAYPDNDYIMVTEMLSDNVDDRGPVSTYSDRFVEQVYAWQDVTESNNESPQNYWDASYQAIITANQAIAAIDEMGANTTKLRQAKAEALLCRAYNHFMLANVFCKHYNEATAGTDLGIPYMTALEEQLNLHHERGTVAEVYENIDKDIQEALPMIGDDIFSVPKFHFNQRAAYGFATRFYLFYGKWEKAIQYANQCLGGNPQTMLRDWSTVATLTRDFDVHSNHFISTSLNCNLLLMTAYSNLGLVFGPYTTWKRFAHGPSVAATETCNANNIWGGPTAFYDQPKNYSGSNRAYVIWYKLPYLFEYTDPVAQVGYRRTIYPALTTDEVLLSRAEALIMLKRYDEALRDLNIWMHNITKSSLQLTVENIKEFYNSVEYSYDVVDDNGNVTGEDGTISTIKKHLHPAFAIDAEGSDQECMLQCVLGFRRIETLQLGLRWFDVKRYGIKIPRRQLNADGNPEKVLDWLTLDDERRAVQIPIDVVDAGIEPNPRLTTNTSSEIEAIKDNQSLIENYYVK